MARVNMLTIHHSIMEDQVVLMSCTQNVIRSHDKETRDNMMSYSTT